MSLADEGLTKERRRSLALRDFLEPSLASETTDEDEVTSALDFEKLAFIDEPAEGAPEGADGSEAEETLNNSECRLRRWRAASRRLRRPRIIDNLCGGGAGEGRTDLADRLRSLAAAGSVSASAGELLSLAPPSAAVTAPPSPAFLNAPSLADQSAVDYFGSSPECCAEPAPAPPPGPRYKLATEGPLQVCCFHHTRTVIDKILTSKFLRRWETHVLCLLEDNIASKTPCGLLERPLSYCSMQEVYCISRWDPAGKFCLRIVMPHGSLLLQATNAYSRDQWFHSIIWQRNMMKYRKIFTKASRKEIVIKELKNMVDYVMTTPLHDESVASTPLQFVTKLLTETEESWEWMEAVVGAAAPLLAERGAPGPLCELLARLCRRRPRAAPLPALAPPVRRVLTRNVDFARAPHARRLVTDYISALSCHNSGASLVRRFVEVTHGPRGSTCPHPRAAPNLAAVALAALNDHFRDTEAAPLIAPPPAGSPPLSPRAAFALHKHICDDTEDDVLCFADILLNMCEFPDWLVVVGGVLQPVPLCAGALRCPAVAARMAGVLRALAADGRCAAHGCVAPARAARQDPPTWLRTAAPSDPLMALSHYHLCQVWGDMVKALLNCCCRRKSFLQEMSKQLPDFLLVALTEHPAAIEALCLMLEWDVASGEQTRLEIVAALQGTELGQQQYKQLCERQQQLKELQAEGGPRRLALPVRATDADVARLLTAGSFGNLECLSLAFTSVTSACAYELIKLPTLRYLNLWATQFGDSGVQLIAEHLPRLQVLNLCETPISDKGIEALAALSSLRRLNLNSTKLSAEAFEDLKQRLPQLQEFDIRYTEAW